jgi:hypothetical protein
MKGNEFKKMWFHWLNAILILALAVLMAGTTCLADDFGAIISGNWNDASTWTSTAIPGSSDTVYIGSTYPSGALGHATVTLIQDQSAGNVTLGYGTGTSGTLNMGGHALNANYFYFGYYEGSFTLLNRGPLTAYSLYLGNQAFNLAPTDSVSAFNLYHGTTTLNTHVSDLYLYENSTATTTTADNVTESVVIYGGSTLTLGADMTLSGSLNLQDHGSTLDMAYHAINASLISLNSSSGSPILSNRGQLTAYSLNVYNHAFDLNATDSVHNFNLSNGSSTLNSQLSTLTLSNNATATTTAAGNVTGSVSISSGSKLTLGADMTLSGDLNLYTTGSTLDMAGHALSASQISFGWYGGSPTLLNRGRLTANNLYVTNQTFDLNATDTVSTFNLSNGTSTINTPISNLSLDNNSTATWYTPLSSLSLGNNSTAVTTAAGNVTGGVSISGGSKLTLGADMTLSNNLNLQDTGSTLDMAGHSLSATQILFGWYGGSPTLLNRGQLTANNLYVTNRTFDLNATDTVSTFNLSNGTSTINTPLFGLELNNSTATWSNSLSWLNLYNNSTATTTAAANVTGSVGINNGSKLTLGADMTLSGTLDMRDNGSTLEMALHSLSANQILLGWYGGLPTFLNSGRISANYLSVGNANTLTMHSGDLINNYLTLSNSSALTVQQANGQLTGLTLNGTSQGNLSINDTSVLNLQFGQSRFSHWIFRWRDPNSSSNWGDALTSLIGAGRISINLSNGYFLADSLGYTYIYAVAQPADFDWKGGNSGGPTDWGIAANWNPNTGVPYGKSVFLSFGAQAAANNVVDMGSSGKTVGGMIFVSATSTTIQSSGGHDLTLDNNGEISTIDVSGNHFITTPVIMNNDVQVIGIGALTLSGGISGHHNLDVQGNLVAGSIEVDTLTIESGATVTIQAIPGGPLGNTITAVPEPSALVLMGIGSIGLLAYAWRRRWRRIA